VIRGLSPPLISRNRKVCPRASLDIIFIARTRNDPSSPEERRRVSRCFTKWHREEISGPSSAPPRAYRMMRISLAGVARGGVDSRARGPYIFTLAHVSSPSSPSCSRCRFDDGGRRPSALDKGGKIRALSLARPATQKLFPVARAQRRNGDTMMRSVMHYAYAQQPEEGCSLTENRFPLSCARTSGDPLTVPLWLQFARAEASTMYRY